MCGRFTYSQDRQQTAEAFGLDEPPIYQSRYNIAPSNEVLAIVEHPERTREYRRLRWGLIPRWADDPAIGNRLINARCETAATKPSFRDAMRHRHCLVLADGFYEWEKKGRVKQPYYIRMRDGRPFAFAGLWERNDRVPDSPIDTCTILTTDANETIKPIHERMPVILCGQEDYDLWLEGGDALERLWRPYDGVPMTSWPVSRLVNSPRHDAPDCIEAIE